MLEWGEVLIKELAARRCIIFFGAGASASCAPHNGTSRMPSWEGLLNVLCGRIRNHQEEQALAQSMIESKKYLDAAEVIVSALNRADYVDAMQGIFERPRFRPSRIHEAILKIDPKVAITTNFDTVYDTYCRGGLAYEGYNVFKHTDTHVVSQLRSPIRCVLKAHGCITNPETMVLTRSEFFAARQKSPHFFKILDALFLTQTILFIGYSLNDPDIQLTLENANIASPSSHRHYFVTGSGTPSAIKQSWEKTYNLEILEFMNGNYAELEEALLYLAVQVDDFRRQNPAL